MELETSVILLLILLVSTYVQTTVGFGAGLIVVSVATVFDIVPVIFSAALVSFTSFFHMLVAMQGEWRRVDWRQVKMIVAGLIPGVFVGVQLLDLLSRNSVDLLKYILGIVVLLAASVSLFNFRQYKYEPGPARSILFGAAGGLGGGMFSNSAAPIVYHLHKQNVPFSLIRNTLFVVFLVSTSTRIIIISAKGHVDAELLTTVAMALPVIAVTTYVAKKFPAPFSVIWMRRISFGLLAIMGVSLIVT